MEGVKTRAMGGGSLREQWRNNVQIAVSDALDTRATQVLAHRLDMKLPDRNMSKTQSIPYYSETIII